MQLHRLEDVYARDGLELARSTMCGWHAARADVVRPLVAAMREDAFKQPYLCVDAMGVLVQQKERCRTGHFWVLVAPGRHVLFEFTRDHSSDAVDDVLAGYQGYLVADAHVVYDHLYQSGDVVEVNCWAHARRYFFKALASDPERAKVALGFIGALFRIERTLADSPRKKKEKIRDKRSRPSSTPSSRGATPKRRPSSTTHPSPTAFATRATTESASHGFSTTAACPSTTT